MAATNQPHWLDIADVKGWLRLPVQDASDDDLLNEVTAMTESYVERVRPEFHKPGTTIYEPNAEIYQVSVMFAAKLYRRRNSPAGIESFGETVSYVTRYDPDIDRGLQTGAYAGPVVS